MPEYTIEYKEVISKRVNIVADSEEEALNEAGQYESNDVEHFNYEYSDYTVTRDLIHLVDEHDDQRSAILDLARDNDATQVRMYIKHGMRKYVYYPTDEDLVQMHKLLGKQIRKMKKEGRL